MTMLRHLTEKSFCFGLVFLLTPGYYIFHMTIIRPHIVKLFKMGTARHLFHVSLSLFIFVNICGNMFLAIFTDTRVSQRAARNKEKSGRFCVHCNLHQPLKSFHCKTCNMCILRRDHHCIFFSRCIGLYNQRYYVLYLVYVTVGLIYSTYFDFYFVSSMYETSDFIIAVLRVFNPLVHFLSTEPVGIRDLYVLFFDFNGIFIFWGVTLLTFHFKNMLRGITAYEFKNKVKADTKRWKENMINIFGERWYLAIIWPFVGSPLPPDYHHKFVPSGTTDGGKTV